MTRNGVAPHAGSVDRNVIAILVAHGLKWVAPHAGSVDRNFIFCNALCPSSGVAPHAGSVDRNVMDDDGYSGRESRSPRGERG